MNTLRGPKLTCCIVLYKPDREVLETVRCLAESTLRPELFIVNNSPKDTEIPEEIAERWPGTVLIESRKNVGFGEANNEMLTRVRGAYHLICNPDITLAPDVLEAMVRWMDENPDVGVLSPKVLNPDGTEQFLPRRSPTVRYLLGGTLAKRGEKLLRRAEALAEEGRHHRLCEMWWRSRGYLPPEEKPEETPPPPPEEAEPFNPENHVTGEVIDVMPERRRRSRPREEEKTAPLRDSLVRGRSGGQTPEETHAAAMERHMERGLTGLLARRPTLTALWAEHLRRRGTHLRGLRAHYTMEDDPPREPVDVEFATGCFLLIRSKLFYRLGGFDRRFFLYHEDSDLSLRARELARVVYHPGFCVTHAWHRASSHSFKARCHHILSTVKFFAKWGWAW